MEKIRGFARVLARKRVSQQLNKRFLGKPYVKYGQCLVLCGYSFQLGGILGAKHRANLDAFAHAFLGATGEPGVVKHSFTEAATNLVSNSLSESMTFGDYVSEDLSLRLGNKGDQASFFIKHAMDKLLPEQAEELTWQYALDGAILGSIYPTKLREMFECQHSVVPKEEWDLARAAGLDISVEQDVMSYEEIEEGENEVFMGYCQECCPELHAVLAG
jgi:hypothetical protein